MKILIMLLAALPLLAQVDVRVICEAEPHSSDLPGIKDTALYPCSVTNFSNQQVMLSPGMLMAAVPTLHPIAPARAAEIVKNANNNSGKSKALRYIKYGTYIALAVTGGGAVAASKIVVASIGLALGLTGEIQTDIIAAQPDLSAYAENIPVTGLTLAPFQQPGFSATFTLRAAGPATTVQGQIYFPSLAPAVKAETAPSVPVVPTATHPPLDTHMEVATNTSASAVVNSDLIRVGSPDDTITIMGRTFRSRDLVVSWASTLGDSAKTPAPLDESDRFSAEFVALVAMQTMR